MEGRRRQKWDNIKRSEKKKPPRVTWQPTVPKWEKEFCKVVGSLDWETLLQMKKFTHLYENVLNWDDSAGEEALSNAKKRYWAGINGLSCHLLQPDPDLYIDKIDWDSEIDTLLWPECEPELTTCNLDGNHEPVVIFGDSLFANQSYSLGGWGDEGENLNAWDNNMTPPINQGDDWGQNWVSSSNNGPAIESTGHSNNELNWTYCANNTTTDQVGIADDNNDAENVSAGENMCLARRNDGVSGPVGCWGPQPDGREWNSFHSCGLMGHGAALAVGRTWHR